MLPIWHLSTTNFLQKIDRWNICYLTNVYTKVKLDLATLDNLDVLDRSENYWKKYQKAYKNSKIYKNNSLKKDEFYKSFKYQIDKKLKHTINLKVI